MRRFLAALALCALLCPAAHAEAPQKYIALTFDDGPSGRCTECLLDGLAAREVHATFFLCGYRVEQYPALAARIAQEGHEIGSHSDRHEFFTHMSAEAVCADLHKAEETISAATGQTPRLLRPPGGLYDPDVLASSVCAEAPVVLWSIDPEDWRDRPVDTVVNFVTRRAGNGDIILLHDMHVSSVEAALRIIDTLEARGFTFVMVSELALLSGTTLEGGKAYCKFYFPKYE